MTLRSLEGALNEDQAQLLALKWQLEFLEDFLGILTGAAHPSNCADWTSQ